jgi:hypothetical protein
LEKDEDDEGGLYNNKGNQYILIMELKNDEDKCDMMIATNNSCMGSPMIHFLKNVVCS